MIVYICSPYRAPTDDLLIRNISYAQEIGRELVLQGESVIIPHLYYTNFLDDDVKEERELGLKSALELLKICEYVFVADRYGISEGMKGEIAEARRLGVDVFFSEEKWLFGDNIERQNR